MTGTTVAETQRRGLIAELAELQPVKRTFFAEHRSVQDFHFTKNVGVFLAAPPKNVPRLAPPKCLGPPKCIK